MNKTYRQGDVYLDVIEAVPANALPLDIMGRVVIAEGEVTGHAHAFDGPGVQMLQSGEDRYLRIHGSTELRPIEVLDRNDQFARVKTADGLTVRFKGDDANVPAVMDAVARQAAVELAGRMIRHEEHDAIMIPPGAYKIEGQREYQPKGIQRVLD